MGVKWRCGVVDCPECYSGRRGRSVYRGHFGYRQGSPLRRARGMGKFVQAKRPKGAAGSPQLDVGGDPLVVMFPALGEYLTLDKWEDGSAREVATVMLFAEGGLWKVWLNDRAEGRSAWSSGLTSAAAVEAMEGMLASGSVEWRSRPGGGQRGGKRA